MKRLSSPNFNERRRSLEYIVLHYTGMVDAQTAISRLLDPSSEASAHYVVDEDGTILQLVDEKMRAWHAGESFWKGKNDINSASIGIELVNPGHEFGYRPFPNDQISALKNLLADITSRHSLSPKKCLLAHSDVAVTRKTDPGELFPWKSLARDGFGQWPFPDGQDFIPADAPEISALLGNIGYDTANLRAALLAFQRRFYPEKVTGETDGETTARIRALARLD